MICSFQIQIGPIGRSLRPGLSLSSPRLKYSWMLAFYYDYGEDDNVIGTKIVGLDGKLIRVLPGMIPVATFDNSRSLVLISLRNQRSVALLSNSGKRLIRIPLKFKIGAPEGDGSMDSSVGISPTGTLLSATGSDGNLYVVVLRKGAALYEVPISKLLPTEKFLGFAAEKPIVWDSSDSFFFTAWHVEPNPDGYSNCVMRLNISDRKVQFVCWGTLVCGFGPGRLVVSHYGRYQEKIRIFSLNSGKFSQTQFSGNDAFVLRNKLTIISFASLVHRIHPRESLIWITEYNSNSLDVLRQYAAPGHLNDCNFMGGSIFPIEWTDKDP